MPLCDDTHRWPIADMPSPAQEDIASVAHALPMQNLLTYTENERGRMQRPSLCQWLPQRHIHGRINDSLLHVPVHNHHAASQCIHPSNHDATTKQTGKKCVCCCCVWLSFRKPSIASPTMYLIPLHPPLRLSLSSSLFFSSQPSSLLHSSRGTGTASRMLRVVYDYMVPTLWRCCATTVRSCCRCTASPETDWCSCNDARPRAFDWMFRCLDSA